MDRTTALNMMVEAGFELSKAKKMSTEQLLKKVAAFQADRQLVKEVSVKPSLEFTSVVYSEPTNAQAFETSFDSFMEVQTTSKTSAKRGRRTSFEEVDTFYDNFKAFTAKRGRPAKVKVSPFEADLDSFLSASTVMAESSDESYVLGWKVQNAEGETKVFVLKYGCMDFAGKPYCQMYVTPEQMVGKPDFFVRSYSKMKTAEQHRDKFMTLREKGAYYGLQVLPLKEVLSFAS